MIASRLRSVRPLAALALAGCVPLGSRPVPATSLTLARPAGRRDYVFTSRQSTPGGTSSVRVAFTLVTSSDGRETALVTAYQRAVGDTSFVPVQIPPACASRLAAPPGAVAALPITPPPHKLSELVPDCVPEDLFGAASDILPLLMIQMQPRFRAAELRAAGDRLRFTGYETGWRLPPTLLDARIVADSGVVSLESVTASRAVIGWDTSPMRVDLVRQLAPGQRALLSGLEWFRAQVEVDPRSGTLLRARTMVDSLALRMTIPFHDSTVPPAAAHAPSSQGMPVVVTRSLDLRPAVPADRP